MTGLKMVYYSFHWSKINFGTITWLGSKINFWQTSSLSHIFSISSQYFSLVLCTSYYPGTKISSTCQICLHHFCFLPALLRTDAVWRPLLSQTHWENQTSKRMQEKEISSNKERQNQKRKRDQRKVKKIKSKSWQNKIWNLNHQRLLSLIFWTAEVWNLTGFSALPVG